jgi:hypothetical protein
VAGRPPVCLHLETTNRCNLLCTTCPRTYEELEPPADMSWDLFVSIVDQVPGLVRAVLHGVGEPKRLDKFQPYQPRECPMKHLILAVSSAILLLPAFHSLPANAQEKASVSVYSGGKLIGQDPDPNVRFQMLRDAGHENEN